MSAVIDSLKLALYEDQRCLMTQLLVSHLSRLSKMPASITFCPLSSTQSTTLKNKFPFLYLPSSARRFQYSLPNPHQKAPQMRFQPATPEETSAMKKSFCLNQRNNKPNLSHEESTLASIASKKKKKLAPGREEERMEKRWTERCFSTYLFTYVHVCM